TSVLDDGSAGTLRAQVNTAAAGDVITFDPSLNGQTITLTQGQIAINKDLTIQGPGSSALTVSGNNTSRVFNVEGSGVLNVTIADLTVTGGTGADSLTTATGGGAIRSENANLTLSGLTVTGNHATGPGGGILATSRTLTVSNPTVTTNTTDTTDA